jgi:hypothetical protein
MQVDKFQKWALVLIAWLTFAMVGKWSIPALSSWLTFMGFQGLPNFLLGLAIHLVPLDEIFGKLSILQAFKSPKFEPTKAENWPHINLDAFTYYTHELEKLGFTMIGDYIAPTIKGMTRLFAHPELGCFAEVEQLVGRQIACTIFSELEQDWIMSTTNIDHTLAVRARLYAYSRLPRYIHRCVLKAGPTVLLETLLQWRSQVTKDLLIQPLQDVSVEMYFAQIHKRFIKMRHRLLWSSLVWIQLDGLFFWLKPQIDWLGDYPKIKARLAKA